jgi:cell division septum initiation protein DivIVA
LWNRQEHLDCVQREADEIMGAARSRAERLVQRTEIVREAQRTASRMLAEADDAGTRRRHEADDYCDQRLASFEIVLERIIRTVRSGRDKLSAAAPSMDAPIDMLTDRGELDGTGATPADKEEPSGFFDQDMA